MKSTALYKLGFFFLIISIAIASVASDKGNWDLAWLAILFIIVGIVFIAKARTKNPFL